MCGGARPVRDVPAAVAEYPLFAFSYRFTIHFRSKIRNDLLFLLYAEDQDRYSKKSRKLLRTAEITRENTLRSSTGVIEA